MKIWTKGRHLWMRTIGSTIVGEFVDTALFVTVAFWGILPTATLVSVVISNYVFKTGVEALFTPVTYRIVGWLKREESEDYYDHDTDFNPFSGPEFLDFPGCISLCGTECRENGKRHTEVTAE